MEDKVIHEFKIIETEDGFRIEIKGDKERIRRMGFGPFGRFMDREHRHGPPHGPHGRHERHGRHGRQGRHGGHHYRVEKQFGWGPPWWWYEEEGEVAQDVPESEESSEGV